MLLYVVSMATQLLDEAYNHTVIFNIDQKMCHLYKFPEARTQPFLSVTLKALQHRPSLPVKEMENETQIQ